MKNSVRLLLPVFLLAGMAAAQTSAEGSTAQQPAPAAAEQQQQFAANTIIPAELPKSLDAKKAKVGDKIEAKTTMDLLSQGQIILPRGSRIDAHITAATPHVKGAPDSTLGIAFDQVTLKDGRTLPLHAAIQAVGPPLNAFANNTGSSLVPPGGGGGESNNTGTQPAPGPIAGAGSGRSQMPSTGQQAANPGGAPENLGHSGVLSLGSQGVVGIKDISLSDSAQGSVLSSSKRNVHLEGGTQIILRTQ
jgi:hypothetical protein